MLKVSGDSMTGVGIMPGDIAIFQRASSAADGNIVLAQVDNEWTLKTFVNDLGKIGLQAENPKYPAITNFDTLKIHGILKGVVRKIDS